MAVGIGSADQATPSNLQKLALTSPTSGGCSVYIVPSRTQATESVYFYKFCHQSNHKGPGVDSASNRNEYERQNNVSPE
jgi:hypothetical protein